MAKVRLVSPKIPKNFGRTGDVVEMDDRLAERWGRRGHVVIVDDEAAPAPKPAAKPAPEPEAEWSMDDLTVAELRAMLPEDAEIEGTGSGGNVVKADLVRALSRGGYNRRDLRAAE